MRIELNPPPAPAEVVIDPSDSAVVITGARADRPGAEPDEVARWGEGLAAIARILGAARVAGSRVIFVDGAADPLAPADLAARAAVSEATAAALAPSPGEEVLRGPSHDCFHGTGLVATLNRFGLRPCASQIVLAGPDGEVDCAARGCRSRQYLAYYPVDAVFSASEAAAVLATGFVFFHPRATYNMVRTRSDLITFDGSAATRDPLLSTIAPGAISPDEPMYHAVVTDGTYA